MRVVDFLIAFAALASFAVMMVGLVMFLPSEKLKPMRHLARRLSIGGLGALILALVIIPTRPSFKVEQQKRPDEAQEHAASLDDPVKKAAVDFNHSIRVAIYSCADDAAGAYLSGENIGLPIGNLDQYTDRTRQTLAKCKNSVTVLGAITVPGQLPKAARDAANGMIAICQSGALQNQTVAAENLEGLGGAGPFNVKAALTLQKRAMSALDACDDETDKLAKAVGMGAYELSSQSRARGI